MKILIVEEDAALGLFLQKGLSLESHMTNLVEDTAGALDLACQSLHDLIVLDMNLREGDGLALLQQLRERGVDASVLLLTGRNSPHERVRCLDAGADDILLKPFSFSELTARCRALMRRRRQFSSPTLREGDLEMNRLNRKVVRGGRSVDLTGKEFALLEYLMLARGRTCSRTELLKAVWEMSPDAGTNVVDVYVNYLRKKLAGTGLPSTPETLESSQKIDPMAALIETVRGEGYSLAVAIRRKPVQSAGLTLDGARITTSLALIHKPGLFAEANHANA